MSGTLPTSPAPRSLQLTSVYANKISFAQSGKRQVRQDGGHLWRVQVSYAPMTKAQFRPIFAFLHAQEGGFGAFSAVLPDYATPRGIATGSPVVSGGSQVGTMINLTGFTASTTGIMKAGDLIKFAGHSKVYMVTADANSAVAGATTLTIFPPLIASPADAEVVTVSSVPFTLMLDSQELVSPVEINSDYVGVGFSAVEAL